MRLLVFTIFIFTAFSTWAQKSQLQLADEYFSKGQYDKAAAYYDELFNNFQQQSVVYDKYLECLFAMQNFSEAFKINKKIQKAYPNSIDYRADEGFIHLKKGDKDQALKIFQKLIDNLPPNHFQISQLSNRFLKYELTEYAEKTVLQGIKITKEPVVYVHALASIYTQMNDIIKLENHLLNALSNAHLGVDYVENTFQQYFKTEDYDRLEGKLIQQLQTSPNNFDLNELIIWLYYQKKDFYAALLQAKAFDRRNKMNGAKVFEVGQISMKNKDYTTAENAFQYIIDNYKGSEFELPAQKEIVYAREKQVKSKFPIDTAKVRQLISNYEHIISTYGSNAANAELYRRMANLHAFYLHDVNTSIQILEKLLKIPKVNNKLIAEAKLDLGDIYILKNEPWESTLLYSQVEKDNTDTPIGHEAKLRNAKLSYFKGDFEFAKEHLNILKLATSREIANDALKLSLLIIDNTGLDTTTEALSLYSKAELLIFQNKLFEAQEQFQTILNKFPRHSLTDEIYWKLYEIEMKKGDYQKASSHLIKINTDHADDIFGDDAVFYLAKLYEEHLNDVNLAMELYKSIITNYSGSIYVDESRFRYRKLRGDFQ